MKVETYVLPEFWACALINNDFSAMEESEIKELNKFIEDNREENCRFYCINCSDEAYFKWCNDATSLGGNVLEYIFDVSPL